MAAVKKNLLIEQNAAWHWAVQWTNSKLRPHDLTGWTAKLQMRVAQHVDAQILFELSTANGRISILPKGIIDMHILDEDTLALPFSVAFYDLLLTSPAGANKRLYRGTVSVSPGVTL